MKKNVPQKNQSALKPPSSRKANRYFILVFFLWAFILYGNTILNKYAVDDEFVTNNDVVKQGLKAVPEIFKTHYAVQKGNVSTQVSDYRPVVKLTFLIEHQLWGERPGVSHGINVLFYFWLSTVLFFVLKRLLHNYNILFPFLITILFMAHPVHTEVVASLKNRDEMIAFLCALLAMRYFLKYADTRKYVYIGIGVLIFFTGYLAKSSILPFLALYPLVFWFFTDLKPKQYLPVFVMVFITILVAHFLPRAFLPDADRVNSYIENPLYFEKSFWLRLGTGLVSLLFYLRILIYPHPLIYYYGYDMIPVVTP